MTTALLVLSGAFMALSAWFCVRVEVGTRKAKKELEKIKEWRIK